MLRLAAHDPAIREGETYDLNYCNLASDGFNRDTHYAFLRHKDKETLLVVSNFSPHEARIKINIPAHAFEWLGIPQTDKLNANTPVAVTVPAMDGVIVRL